MKLSTSFRILSLLLICTVLFVENNSADASDTIDRPGTATQNRSNSPNIIYILADDLGYGDVGAFNPNCKIKTPHMDQLAKQGMRFTDAHSGSAVCTPTRYGVLTGRYAWRTRLQSGVLWGYSLPLIESRRLTVASMLKEKGYSTGCVGKWHLGLEWARHDESIRTPDNSNLQWDNFDFSKPLLSGPNQLGFDYFFGISASLDMHPHVYIENDKVTKMVNDSIVTNEAELARAENAVFAAHYVVCQPFDLLKSGATLTLDETITHNGKECYVIKVNYPGDDEDADSIVEEDAKTLGRYVLRPSLVVAAAGEVMTKARIPDNNIKRGRNRRRK